METKKIVSKLRQVKSSCKRTTQLQSKKKPKSQTTKKYGETHATAQSNCNVKLCKFALSTKITIVKLPET